MRSYEAGVRSFGAGVRSFGDGVHTSGAGLRDFAPKPRSPDPKMSIRDWGSRFWAEKSKPRPQSIHVCLGFTFLLQNLEAQRDKSPGPPWAKGSTPFGVRVKRSFGPKPSYFTWVLASGREGLVQGAGEGGEFTPSPLRAGLDTYHQRVDGFLNDFGPQLGGPVRSGGGPSGDFLGS